VVNTCWPRLFDWNGAVYLIVHVQIFQKGVAAGRYGPIVRNLDCVIEVAEVHPAHGGELWSIIHLMVISKSALP